MNYNQKVEPTSRLYINVSEVLLPSRLLSFSYLRSQTNISNKQINTRFFCNLMFKFSHPYHIKNNKIKVSNFILHDYFKSDDYQQDERNAYKSHLATFCYLQN